MSGLSKIEEQTLFFAEIYKKYFFVRFLSFINIVSLTGLFFISLIRGFPDYFTAGLFALLIINSVFFVSNKLTAKQEVK
jgi:hypothetical protein